MQQRTVWMLAAAVLLAGCGPTATGTPPRADAYVTPPDTGLLRSSFDECVVNAAGVTPATQACIESEFEFHDARLQAAYQKQQQTLDGDAQQAFKQAQDEWLATRDAECAWSAEEGGQAQRLEANLCYLRSTAQRARELEPSP